MDMWKALRNSTTNNAPQAAMLFDKSHVLRHLSEALDKIHKQEYARLSGKDRKYIKGRKYTLLPTDERRIEAHPNSCTMTLEKGWRVVGIYTYRSGTCMSDRLILSRDPTVCDRIEN